MLFSLTKCGKSCIMIDNLFINTKYFKNGEWASPCENCKITFENVYMPKKGN